MDFLTGIYECICTGAEDELHRLMEENRATPVSTSAFEEFTQLFAAEEKRWLKGCVNIHGMGGTGIPKVNLTSIACLYLSVMTELPIAKTGSRKNTGVMGSTDFFEELGLLAIGDRKRMLETFGFVYFDYLELSPWKAYKQFLRKNQDISDILDRYHFFEYEIGILGLGVSSKSLYDRFLSQIHYPKPAHCFTFSSEVNGRLFDEVVDTEQCGSHPGILTRQEISKMNYELVYGMDQNSYWLGALRESVAAFSMELEIAASWDEGREKFDKVYADRCVANKLSQMCRLLGNRKA